MYNKKALMSLIIIFIVIFSGCNYSKKANILNPNNKQKSNNTFKNNSIDQFLSKQKFDISQDINKKILYVYLGKEKIKKYTVTNNSFVNINVDTNKMFVISLHESSIICAKWRLQNSMDNSNVELLKNKRMNIPFKNSNDLVGIDYTRRNFYFTTLKKGFQAITFKYVNRNASVSECFTVTINLNIN
ncbi:hypothetical protein BJV85_000207 [Clostridium acetobutylicum]|uniref:Proteinase inhibitor I42 chagasin domain-containing protein n=1 Tax=Clostridium acetobutylicum (strain ATCC 824 / DSM 792 / JCM 1419 / IAM 19013 / LMG 5710 / NBRC 13948 / NRRL B-527 / VKM B-1787 / 2291 / W) TaxID=272562 RepID=Q97CZ7_CLOAB|nr:MULTISPECIES: protease inhibitor I42 family protein [Clostridium]AAK81613.1 Hypothetical protein CA_C3692 [Clostridium acetobutylicum ATCC 824]ADZ22736.1 Conserved hypothetical protein [Clostridium acetobutylicum EA 2018]AEI32992.1 hypothetical protein SMB_G3734 [Clostridium acetobutylicum DSM 1731]AWV80712.1 hypothetical protein DK921_11495 [Clostridium acetobutylicum]MBC2393964.1 protease inhibitor I42 family protein [Clostridium acetobutylicum]